MKSIASRCKTASSSRIYVTFLGLLAGFTGTVHGFAEISRGNVPTEGLLLSSVGVFTVIPNYLLTGIAAIIVAISLVAWIAFFIHRRHGTIIMMLLSVLLFLVGGGIAIAFFFPFLWGVSSRINKLLPWWRKALSGGSRATLARLWLPAFGAGSIFLSIGIGIWLFLTPPGTAGKAPILYYICWASLALGFILQLPAIVFGFARDIGRQESPKTHNI